MNELLMVLQWKGPYGSHWGDDELRQNAARRVLNLPPDTYIAVRTEKTGIGLLDDRIMIRPYKIIEVPPDMADGYCSAMIEPDALTLSCGYKPYEGKIIRASKVDDRWVYHEVRVTKTITVESVPL